MIQVTVWGENVHERNEAHVRAIYPDGMHHTIAAGISELLADGVTVRTATLDGPEHGVTDTVLGGTDVLVWWGHIAHDAVDPAHPITVGVPQPIVIEAQEMYGEHFDIPAPDDLVFVSSFAGGEVFRSGCCFRRGIGRIFYFSPGDQDYPVYHHRDVRCVLANAVEWVAPASNEIDYRADNPYAPQGWFA